jgi:hypothetical protein
MGFFGSKKVRNPILVPANTTEYKAQDHRLEFHPPSYQNLPAEFSHSQSWQASDSFYSQPPFQTPGPLPPPGWSGNVQPSPLYHPPIIVNQHYYFSHPPNLSHLQPPRTSGERLCKLKLSSALNVAEELCPGTGLPRLLDDNLTTLQTYGTQLVCQGAPLYDLITARIDQGRFTGNEHCIFPHQPDVGASLAADVPTMMAQPSSRRRERVRDQPKGQATAVASSVMSSDYFAKVELYANSRLPLNLPPLKLYGQVPQISAN